MLIRYHSTNTPTVKHTHVAVRRLVKVGHTVASAAAAAVTRRQLAVRLPTQLWLRTDYISRFYLDLTNLVKDITAGDKHTTNTNNCNIKRNFNPTQRHAYIKPASSFSSRPDFNDLDSSLDMDKQSQLHIHINSHMPIDLYY